MRTMTPPTFMLFCLLGMITLHLIFPVATFSNWASSALGIVFMIFGLVIAVQAESQFRKHGTTVDPLGTATKLVTDGWFKYSRNPMYLSMLVILLGAWLALGSVSPLVAVAVYVLFTERWYIIPEEKRLGMAFGKDYVSYQRRTPRWL